MESSHVTVRQHVTMHSLEMVAITMIVAEDYDCIVLVYSIALYFVYSSDIVGLL